MAERHDRCRVGTRLSGPDPGRRRVVTEPVWPDRLVWVDGRGIIHRHVAWLK
jgi:hypothetical protein